MKNIVHSLLALSMMTLSTNAQATWLKANGEDITQKEKILLIDNFCTTTHQKLIIKNEQDGISTILTDLDLSQLGELYQIHPREEILKLEKSYIQESPEEHLPKYKMIEGKIYYVLEVNKNVTSIDFNHTFLVRHLIIQPSNDLNWGIESITINPIETEEPFMIRGRVDLTDPTHPNFDGVEFINPGRVTIHRKTFNQTDESNRRQMASSSSSSQQKDPAPKNVDSPKNSECHGCLKSFPSTKLMRCTACTVTSYCSKECQKKDWKAHKQFCKTVANARLIENKSSFASASNEEKFQRYLQAMTISERNNFPLETDTQASASNSASSQVSQLPLDQKQYVERLKKLSLDSILDNKTGGKKICKNIGQEAFDFFKKKYNGNSQAAFEDLRDLVDSIYFSGGDGSLRKQYIERAFDQVGDDVIQWMA